MFSLWIILFSLSDNPFVFFFKFLTETIMPSLKVSPVSWVEDASYLSSKQIILIPYIELCIIHVSSCDDIYHCIHLIWYRVMFVCIFTLKWKYTFFFICTECGFDKVLKGFAQSYDIIKDYTKRSNLTNDANDVLNGLRDAGILLETSLKEMYVECIIHFRGTFLIPEKPVVIQ